MSFRRQLQFKYQNLLNAFKSLSLPTWMNSVASRVVLSGLVLLLGSAYIFQTSAAATRGYEMASLEKQMSNLEADIQKVSVAIAKESSLAALDVKLENTKMVAVSGVKFINTNSGEMALR